MANGSNAYGECDFGGSTTENERDIGGCNACGTHPNTSGMNSEWDRGTWDWKRDCGVFDWGCQYRVRHREPSGTKEECCLGKTGEKCGSYNGEKLWYSPHHPGHFDNGKSCSDDDTPPTGKNCTQILGTLCTKPENVDNINCKEWVKTMATNEDNYEKHKAYAILDKACVKDENYSLLCKKQNSSGCDIYPERCPNLMKRRLKKLSDSNEKFVLDDPVLKKFCDKKNSQLDGFQCDDAVENQCRLQKSISTRPECSCFHSKESEIGRKNYEKAGIPKDVLKNLTSAPVCNLHTCQTLGYRTQKLMQAAEKICPECVNLNVQNVLAGDGNSQKNECNIYLNNGEEKTEKNTEPTTKPNKNNTKISVLFTLLIVLLCACCACSFYLLVD